jgi:hypothetical protein
MQGAPTWIVVGLLLVLMFLPMLATLDAAQGSLETIPALLAVTCLGAALWIATTTWKVDAPLKSSNVMSTAVACDISWRFRPEKATLALVPYK